MPHKNISIESNLLLDEHIFQKLEDGNMKKIPALTLSGGTLRQGERVLEYRVWVHPNSEDFYLKFKNKKSALKGANKLKKTGFFFEVEKPIAVIWDKTQHGYREVIIPKKKLGKVI